MLKSDPALVYYFTERVLESGGGLPADFRADPRIHHPDTTDVLEQFTVSQEFLIAWAYRSSGTGLPLHVFAVYVMALTASLVALGVFLWTRSATGRTSWALLAAFLALALPANYRTIGFILVREDLALPLLVLHLGTLAGAVARGGAWRFALSGLWLALALASWHAMRFCVAIEALLAWGWFLATGANVFRRPAAWLMLLAPWAAGLLVPVLRANLLLLSAPSMLALSLLLAARFPAGSRRRQIIVAGLSGVLLILGATFLSGTLGASSYAHVTDVLLAKLRHGGRLPLDPTQLSFDARLLWQGPFATLEWSWGFFQLRGGLLLVLVGAVGCAFGARAWNGEGLTVLASLGVLPVAWLFERLVVLPGFLLPVSAALLLSRWRSSRWAFGVFGAVLLTQALSLQGFADGRVISWYLPAGQAAERAAMLDWVEDNVPPGEAVVSDFMNSPAILAQTGRPICLQPKYETADSRRRAQEFLETYFHGSPEGLRRLVRERFRARYLVIDRYTLGTLSAYAAGIGPGQSWAPGTPAALFQSTKPGDLDGVPGFELVYRSSTSPRSGGRAALDFYRVYELP